MKTIRVRVENGKLVGPAPKCFPEGTEIDLQLADPGDDMTEEELRSLNEALHTAWRSIRDGKSVPIEDVISELRTNR